MPFWFGAAFSGLITTVSMMFALVCCYSGFCGFSNAIFLLPVANRCPNGVLSQHRAVNLHRRKSQLLHNIGVLDFESFGNCLALHPLRRKRRRSNGRPATEGLELGFFNYLGLGV